MHALTFEKIDKTFEGQISSIIDDMGNIAADDGWYEGYAQGKEILSRFVGHYAQYASTSELKTSKVYDIVTDKLLEACYRGDDVYQARRKADHDLELQGVYRNDKAKEEFCCVKDWARQCTPKACMAWRRVDCNHGYCVFIGCSWTGARREAVLDGD